MNAAIQPEQIFRMSEYLNRDEIKQMIDDAVSRGVEHGITRGLDSWQARYNLGPEHWVFLRNLYGDHQQSKSTILKMAVTSVVTAVIVIIVLGLKEWVKQTGG